MFNWCSIVSCFSFSVILCCFAAEGVTQEFVEYKNARLIAVQNTVVASEAPGIIKEILIEPGKLVDLDQLIVQLNSEVFQAELGVAEAEEQIAELQASSRVNLEFAKKSAEVTEKTLTKSLNANQLYAKAIPGTEIERLRLQLEQARLSGDQALMELEVAQLTASLRAKQSYAAAVKLNARSIRVPFSGTIAQVYVQVGQWVNAGEPIARVINLNNLRVEGYFDDDYVRKIGVGSKAQFSYQLGGQQFDIPVTVSYVSPEIVEGIFQVWADIDNLNLQHVPGLDGTLKIELSN